MLGFASGDTFGAALPYATASLDVAASVLSSQTGAPYSFRFDTLVSEMARHRQAALMNAADMPAATNRNERRQNKKLLKKRVEPQQDRARF